MICGEDRVIYEHSSCEHLNLALIIWIWQRHTAMECLRHALASQQ